MMQVILPFKQGYFIFVILILILSSTIHSQSLRINEFMAENDSNITDYDGDYSDWIEIYNSSSESVSYSGWSLTDDSTNMQKWLLPSGSISPKGYLLIYASGKDFSSDNELHLNFKLSADGEYLALSSPDNSIVSEFRPAFPQQKSNIAYAYKNGKFYYSTTPTPGAENIITEAMADPPLFNYPHGFYDKPFYLSISTSSLSNTVYYTMDGSEPSSSNGMLYTGPIEINTTTILRAVAVYGNSLSSINTATYLFLEDVINQSNDPLGYPDTWGPYIEISGNAIADYEMDREVTRENPSEIKDALLALPTMSIVTKVGNLFSNTIDPDTGGIYIYTGDADDRTVEEGGAEGGGWERPASVEYFNADGSQSFQIDCGLRIHGGHSRRPEKTPKHSFHLAFKEKYGNSKLNYPIFTDKSSVQSFNALILRAGFGNSMTHHSHSERLKTQYIRDLWAKQTQRDMGYLSGHVGYVHLYLNGIYWGIYNPTERLDKNFAESYYGKEENNFDIIKDYEEVVDGNANAWNEMKAIVNSGLESNKNYQRLLGNNSDGTRNTNYPVYLDIINFIDYMLINYYGANWDWDHHNWAAIRDRTNPDVGFQFFSWDAEHIIEDINADNLDLDNSGKPTGLFKALIQNESFRKLFAERVQKHFYNGGALSPQKNIERWMKFADQLEPAIIAEVARWGDYRRDVHPWRPNQQYILYDKQVWLDQLSFIVDKFFVQRGEVFINQLRNAGLFPNIVAPTFYINGKKISDNTIETGDTLSMNEGNYQIYYTTDGSGILSGEDSKTATKYVLVPPETDKHAIVPSQTINDDWLSDPDFDDSDWYKSSGSPGGVGYENSSGYESYISLDVGSEMNSKNTSCYVRINFNLSEETLQKITELSLGLLYDDGFTAFLNGQKVASSNAPNILSYNSSATAGHEATGFITFNISQYVDQLVAGKNLLAIQALNNNLTSSDFIINAELSATDAALSGTLSPKAALYNGPIILKHSILIKARSLSGTEWSALSEKLFSIQGDLHNLTISEIHYHPSINESADDDRLYEFIELRNKNDFPLDISGVYFSNGITYQFSEENLMNPKEYIVLASDKEKFLDRYGFSPFDKYTGYLDNSGERIILMNSKNDTILNLQYNDKSPWPESADGGGYSLVQAYPDSNLNLNDGSNWRASRDINGSPGFEDPIISDLTEQLTVQPTTFSLQQNYPNPFNPNTKIIYSIPSNLAYRQSGEKHEMSNVKLIIYDILGREVATLVNQKQKPGNYNVEWNAGNLPSGIYFYRLISSTGFSKVRKMVLLK